MSFAKKPRGDREKQKFCETPSGEVAVRVCTETGEPIEVTFTDPADEVVTNTYGEANSVASAGIATIVTYTVPAGKTFFLHWVEVSGENIARYSVEIASSTVAKKRTYFGGNIATEFDFSHDRTKGLSVAAGTKIDVKVDNYRPQVADFEGRILGILKG